MKLFRFELKEDPGKARSGMVHNGRIYETENAEAVRIHEADAVVPLSPVPQPGSLRIFRTQNQNVSEDYEPVYFYGNPSTLIAASRIINVPSFVGHLSFEPYLAAVMVTGGYDIELQEADDYILGVTIMTALVNRSAMRVEALFGRTHDLGSGFGPVVTTPDELDDFVEEASRGRRYSLSAIAKVNGVERARGNTADAPYTIAEAVAAASRSCILHEGDVIAIGPICDVPDDLRLEAGDDLTVSVENLGALSIKLSTDA